MPAFDFPPLLWWGLPAAAAPVLIHLINLLRHRRVRFAAMELLLASQRKYRTRVLLQQVLLLALRTAAVAGIVLALAQPRWRAAVGGLFGGGRHIVLLDDSLSMGERSPSGTAFERGRAVVGRIAAAAADRGESFGLAVFSGLAGPEAAVPPPEPATPETVRRVRDELAGAEPAWSATDPRAPLDRALALVETTPGSDTTLWMVSDFRLRDWQDEQVAATLRRLAEAGVAIRLVDCGFPPPAGATDGRSVNLTLTRLEAVGGVPATGVLVPIEVEIRNDGPGTARDVQLDLREEGATRPGLGIAEIPAGGTATRRFEVRFARAGSHVVEARLPDDRLPADDRRTCVVDVVDRVDVLLVADPDASVPGSDAFHVAAALAPGTTAATGLRPRVERPTAVGTLDLSPFDCVWILDVERLDDTAIANLERHAAEGGGVVFFCGPRTRPEIVNDTLHRGGEGLFPVPLAGAVEVLPGPGRVPDIVAEPHPVVAVLSGTRNPLLDAVRVDRVMAVDRGFDEAAAGLRRLLSLREGGPLVVERPFGRGLATAILSTAAPTWNNWSRGNPSWVVVMLELQSHLARQRRRSESLPVGGDVRVPLDPARDEIEVDFLVPPDAAVVRQLAKAGAGGVFEARLPARVPGGYIARWRRVDGAERERAFAVNVDAAEGRLERAGRELIDERLAGVPFRMDAAADLDPDDGVLAGSPLAQPLLATLLAVLLLEQVVARAVSYHAVRGRGR